MSFKRLKIFYFCSSLLFATQVFAESSGTESVLNAQTGTMGLALPADISAPGTAMRIIADDRSVQAPGIVNMGATPAETCMATASVVKSFFGIVYAHTNMEINTRCANRLDAREMRTMYGEKGVKAAKQIMCEGNPVIQMAWRKIGDPCIGYEEEPTSTKKEEEKTSKSPSQSKTLSTKRNEFAPHQWFDDIYSTSN